MPLDEFVQSLVKVNPGKNSFLSTYLDLRPEGRGKKLHSIFLKNRMSELAQIFPAHSREQALLARDIKRVQKYVEEKLDPSWKGIALFACAAEDFFLPIPLPLPPENEMALSYRPHLFSLMGQAGLFRPYAIIAADSRQARLFWIQDGRLTKQRALVWEEEHTTRFGRMGLSLQKFQRHIQEHTRQRMKEAVENLLKWAGRDKMEYLFTITEEGMEGEMKKHLPLSLKKKQASLSRVDSRDPDHKILSAAFEAIQALSRERAESLARQLLEEAQPLGKATAGPEPTLSALQSHQVERLVLDRRFQAEGWECKSCGYQGTGGVPKACPLCQGATAPAELREAVVYLGQTQEIDLAFTDNYRPLVKAGGIGAMLKFHISGKKGR
jgi:rubrerythrin